MQIMRNVKLASRSGRPLLLDTYQPAETPARGIVVFAHGFKGFKDWGHWNLIAKAFADAGFLFIKFNFSHNGTTPEAPTEFEDLEAFGQNNYTKELHDLDAVLNWLHSGNTGLPAAMLPLNKVALIGHSRGGAVSIIKAAHDERVAALITWAAVSSLAYAWQDPELIRRWKNQGVYHVENSRTKQKMPLYYQMYEDYQANPELFDVKKAAAGLQKPWLILHGTEDPAVPVAAAKQLKEYNDRATLHLIEGANHVFAGAHPFEGRKLPDHARELVEESINFLERRLG
jgi:pimeloyl-ACP methyl ester carboxylesterase